MEQEDLVSRERVPHGGLVRVLKEEGLPNKRRARSKYLWVCSDCRKKSYDYSLDVAAPLSAKASV
jgi:hypothetical protein